jgi:hypothetical protein
MNSPAHSESVACTLPSHGDRAPSVQPLDGRFLTVVLLHAAAIALVSLAATSSQVATPQRPWVPLLLVCIGSLMGQCSLCGIWWVRSNRPLLLKSLLAVVAAIAAWALLLSILDETRRQPDRAAGWGAGLAMQFALTAATIAGLELWISWRRRRRWRFTILSLLTWTTAIACLLAFARLVAAHFGWTPLNFFAWTYFRHLQVLAAANAMAAVAIYAGCSIPRTMQYRVSYAVSAALLAAPATIALMWLAFGRDLGATPIEISLLSILHAALVLATLALVGRSDHNARRSGDSPVVRASQT